MSVVKLCLCIYLVRTCIIIHTVYTLRATQSNRIVLLSQSLIIINEERLKCNVDVNVTSSVIKSHLIMFLLLCCMNSV